MQPKHFDNFYVFCLTAIYLPDSRISSVENLEDLDSELRLSEECKKFGNYVIAITNVTEFTDRIKEYCSQNSYGLIAKLVEYYDPDVFHGYFEGLHGMEAAFRKNKKYEREQEYRFLINTRRLDGPLYMDVDIGDLSGITMRTSIDEINRTIQIRERA